jgi:hypothetical protein
VRSLYRQSKEWRTVYNDADCCTVDGLSDPYAIIRMGETKIKTNYIRYTLDPVWEIPSPGFYSLFVIISPFYSPTRPYAMKANNLHG